MEIATHATSDSSPDGKQLRVTEFRDYTGEVVRTLFPDLADLPPRVGPTRSAGPRSSRPCRSEASTSTRPPMRWAIPRPTPSTCSAMSPSTRPCARAANALRTPGRPARISSTTYGRTSPADPGRAAREVRRARRRTVFHPGLAQGPADLRPGQCLGNHAALRWGGSAPGRCAKLQNSFTPRNCTASCPRNPPHPRPCARRKPLRP